MADHKLSWKACFREEMQYCVSETRNGPISLELSKSTMVPGTG